MMRIDFTLYSLRKKALDEIIINYINEYSNKKIKLSGKNKRELVHIILSNNIEVDCRKYIPNVIINDFVSTNYISSYNEIDKQFIMLAKPTTI
tara:strand:- start:114 stop:392 length:279 start_codon:yes stop_codon:yes gene_type:complete